MDTNTQSEKEKIRLSRIVITIFGVLFILFIIAAGTSIYFYKKANVNPQVDAVKELALTIKQVGRHMVLPTDETPTMATVSDPAKLKDQPFFVNAKKGDKVLIFSQSKKAILYDPTADRIIEVAPINSGAPQQ